jgi:antitoxin VapB
MGLNIKNEEAERLARELAAITGETLTAAITEALRERLSRKRKDDFIDKWVAIGRANAARLNNPLHSDDIDAFLYDEKGLPK